VSGAASILARSWDLMDFMRGPSLWSNSWSSSPSYIWETTSRGGAGGKPLGGGIWNNGSGLKLQRFPCDGILTLEPEESRPIL
jgi:hypothetical protein